MSAHFCQSSSHLPPPSNPVRFLLKELLPLSVRTLSRKTVEELQKLWKSKNSLKKTCILCLFLVFLFIFQSLTQEEDDKMTCKCPLLSSRDHTRKDVYLQLGLLPSLSTVVCIVASPPPPKVWASFKDDPY